MREEGPAALYKGFIPKVLRLAPGGGVLLLVVEFTLGVFRKGSSPVLLSPITIRLTSVNSSRTSLRLIIPRSIGSRRLASSMLIIPPRSTNVSCTRKRIPRLGSGWGDYSSYAHINIKCDTVLWVLCE